MLEVIGEVAALFGLAGLAGAFVIGVVVPMIFGLFERRP
jgi:hypothetical protein